MGLTWDEVRGTPWGLLQDLIAIEQIKMEGFKRKSLDPEGDFWAMVERG